MAMQVQSEIFREGEPRFNWTQYRTQRDIHKTDELISHGLMQRLANYAVKRLDEAGFKPTIEGWECTVYTMDGNESPADRVYQVRFMNSKGGYLEVDRILTRRGWPFIDHGISAGHQ